ncbi:MAG: hypothetical protein HY325_00740, partial [Chloroflexi bacterium]|nr:hypothetical protein [Chloroflexota bacterium]
MIHLPFWLYKVPALKLLVWLVLPAALGVAVFQLTGTMTAHAVNVRAEIRVAPSDTILVIEHSPSLAPPASPPPGARPPAAAPGPGGFVAFSSSWLQGNRPAAPGGGDSSDNTSALPGNGDNVTTASLIGAGRGGGGG